MSKAKTKPPATTVEQRLARPRETPDQRNARQFAAADAMMAKADALRARAAVGNLSARAAAVGLPPRFVTAIRFIIPLADAIDVGPWDLIERVERAVVSAEGKATQGPISITTNPEFDDEEPAA